MSSKCCIKDEDLCMAYSSRLFELIAKKYTYAILIILDKYGRLRFNELQRKMSGITQKALSTRLKELEELKLVKREVEQEPLRVYYSLTTEGRAVKNAIQILISVINLIDNEHKDTFLC
ncbi:winged helix-turn-helix transcriptional regulator [Stygiolobus caldivivus]|uniref:HTH hxlR-type domain-containing protein n=1 Tax=Stygiolobus caldivivus TaxID=2824673 RepID=A0A8D5ZHL2_9CREN|nr:helix-turn-helix domain-containing protein [Stygiolobus caldivivus]BCU68806.1 hypothetical protein KN1_01030 [Stygiolobus caldivivus]